MAEASSVGARHGAATAETRESASTKEGGESSGRPWYLPPESDEFQKSTEFNTGNAVSHFVKGASWGFLGNTLQAIVNNAPLAAGLIGASVALPPLGVILAGTGLLGAISHATKTFKKSKALSEEAERIAKEKPEAYEESGKLLRASEAAYEDLGTDFTTGLTSLLGLNHLGKASKLRALERGELPETALVDHDEKGPLGHTADNLKENITSIARKSEWTDSPLGRWLGSPNRPWQKSAGRASSLGSDAPAAEPDVLQPGPRATAEDLPAPSLKASSSGRQAVADEAAHHRSFVRNNPVVQDVYRRNQALEDAILDNFRTLEKGGGKADALQAETTKHINNLRDNVKALKQLASDGRLSGPLPADLIQDMDGVIARSQTYEKKLPAVAEWHQLIRKNQSLRHVFEDLPRQQDQLLGQLDDPKLSLDKRSRIFKELEAYNQTYKDVLGEFLRKDPEISTDVKRALTEHMQTLENHVNTHKTFRDRVWDASSEERGKLPQWSGGKRLDQVDNTIPAHLAEQHPWSSLGLALDRIQAIRQALTTEHLPSGQQRAMIQTLQEATNQASRLIDQQLTGKALPDQKTMLQQLQQVLRKGRDELKTQLTERAGKDTGHRSPLQLALDLDQAPKPDKPETPALAQADSAVSASPVETTEPHWLDSIKSGVSQSVSSPEQIRQLTEHSLDKARTVLSNPSTLPTLTLGGSILNANRQLFSPRKTEEGGAKEARGENGEGGKNGQSGSAEGNRPLVGNGNVALNGQTIPMFSNDIRIPVTQEQYMQISQNPYQRMFINQVYRIVSPEEVRRAQAAQLGAGEASH